MGIFWGHRQEAQLLSYLKDGVSAFKSRTEEYRAQRSSRTGATRLRERRSSITYRTTTPIRPVGSCSSTLTGMSGELGRRPGLDLSSTI